MRIFTITVLLAALFILSGCWVFSIQPLYEDKDITYDPTLVGTWWQPSAGCTLVITSKPEDRTYQLEYTASKTSDACLFEPGTKFNITGRMVKLNGRMYMDVYQPSRDDGVGFPSVPLHSAYLVTLDKISLSLTPLDDDWLDKAVAGKKFSVERTKTPDFDLILSGPTAELQELYSKHAGDPEAFKKNPKLTFQRK